MDWRLTYQTVPQKGEMPGGNAPADREFVGRLASIRIEGQGGCLSFAVLAVSFVRGDDLLDKPVPHHI
jgi:hypothetical protein